MYNLDNEIKVIKVGSCIVDPGKIFSPSFVQLKQQLNIGGGSTVTLIKYEDDLILVDTGFDNEADMSIANIEINREHLLNCLQLHGVNPSQITKVFITHFHLDHCGNIDSFPDAQWHCSEQALSDYDGLSKERFIPITENDRLTENIAVINTPGHTRGHSSLLWSPRKSIRIAICGDAIINLAWLLSGHVWKFNSDFYGIDKAKDSAARLLNEADILIPGHGEPFFSTPKLRSMFT